MFKAFLLLSVSQVDSNKDRLVSLDEFLVATKKKEFLEPDSWEVRNIRCNFIMITAFMSYLIQKHLVKQSRTVKNGFLPALCSSDLGAEPGLYR